MASNKDRLTQGLSNMPGQPPIKKAPQHYPLSTDNEGDLFGHESENAKTQERTNALTQKSASAKDEPKRVSRGYKLREDLIKSLKRIALEEDRLLYEVMEEALQQYVQSYQEQGSHA